MGDTGRPGTPTIRRMTSSSGHPTLPSGALAAWHRALQSHSLAALTTLVLLAVIVVATIAMDQAPGNAAEVVESAPWLAGSAVQGLGLGALVSVWFAPALGVWLGAAALLAAPFASWSGSAWPTSPAGGVSASRPSSGPPAP